MKKAWLTVLVTLTSCSQVPDLTRVPSSVGEQIVASCQQTYPTGYWTVVHRIEITLPDRGHSMMMGVTSYGPKGIESVLMSPEGVVLFQGLYSNGRIRVERALPPMDDPGFQHQMFRDIRRLFFPPAGALPRPGRIGGKAACRWEAKGMVVDVIPGSPTRMRAYRGKRLVQTVRYRGPVQNGFARTMVLETRGMFGYSMVFTLILTRKILP